MKKVAAIAAEYNPFHRGHAAQLQLLREAGCEVIIAIMSGQFVQRGGAAIADVYTRAELAVSNGVDLAVLLPYGYCAQSAELFAHGAVAIAEKVGADTLAFGCENPSGSELSVCAEILAAEDSGYRSRLREKLSRGLSFAAAREQTLGELTKLDMSFIRRPNNILALQYMTEIKKSASKLSPLCLPRIGALHDGAPDGDIASASHIRELLHSSQSADIYLPYSADRLALSDDEPLAMLLIYLLSRPDAEKLSEIAEVEAGLQNRLIKSRGLLNKGMEQYVQAVHTKRISRARIRRILINYLMGCRADDIARFKNADAELLLALAANARGREYLRSGKYSVRASLAPQSLPAGSTLARLAELEALSFDLFSLCDPTCEPLYRRHMRSI